MPNDSLLQVRNLKTYFYTESGVAKAVDGISFDIREGETLGLVGESGCGKSVTALSIMRLIQNPPGRIEGGEVIFKGRDLLTLSERKMRKFRGSEFSMIFQEPMTSLNPVFTCGDQIAEALILHQNLDRKTAKEKAVELLKLVGVQPPEQRADEYPYQLSGGMRQRVMIAIALSCNPSLLIADEPTTALDVTIQAQILELLADIREQFDMAVLTITHDLGVIAEVADRVAVMYAGKIVEYADVGELFGHPLHPYTKGLLASIPVIGEKKDRLMVIPGRVPEAVRWPAGCRFHPRCALADAHCADKEPELKEKEKGHRVACWKVSSQKDSLVSGEWRPITNHQSPIIKEGRNIKRNTEEYLVRGA